MGVDRVFLDVRLLTTLTAASVLLFVATSPTSPYQHPWNWGQRDATDQALARAITTLDTEVPVRASPSALAALSERPWLFTLPSDAAPAAVNMGSPAFTRAVLVVERDFPERTIAERQEFDRVMGHLGFERSFDAEGVVLYAR
jgi:hypothetical protein